jgi:phosphoserine phosphatase
MKKLTLFDFDNTLVRTSARIKIKDANNITVHWLKNLGDYKLKDGETIDFSDFETESVLQFARPLALLEKLRDLVNKQECVGILSARSSFEIIHHYLETQGITIDISKIFTINNPTWNLEGNNCVRKRKMIEMLIKDSDITHVEVYDDDVNNLLEISKIESTVDIKTILV